MQIGELAAASGLGRDALRFYEKLGLIAAQRRPNGYRDYPASSLPTLLYIRTAQQLGFSLAEIATNLARLKQAPDQAAAIAALLTDKLAVVDQKLAELQALRADLQQRLQGACPLQAALRDA